MDASAFDHQVHDLHGELISVARDGCLPPPEIRAVEKFRCVEGPLDGKSVTLPGRRPAPELPAQFPDVFTYAAVGDAVVHCYRVDPDDPSIYRWDSALHA